jgi:hypothetical protein
MRIIVPNTKGIEEAKRIVDRPVDDFFRSVGGGLLQITDARKSWSGNTMSFSFQAAVVFFSASVEGSVAVGEKEVVIDVNFPDAFRKFITEDNVKTRLEERYRALLT